MAREVGWKSSLAFGDGEMLVYVCVCVYGGKGRGKRVGGLLQVVCDSTYGI